MARRNLIFATNEYYHLFNRTIGKEIIYADKRNLSRMIHLVDHYRFPQPLRYSQFKTLPDKSKQAYLNKVSKETPLVEIFSFAFMPNHFHFLLKQTREHGLVTFISNLQNSFAKFFNLKYKRHGSLFTKPFKGKWVETDEEFVHISRYIHLNPVTSFQINSDDLAIYPWTSLPYYLNKLENRFISTSMLLSRFKTPAKYYQFIKDQADHQRKLGRIKHLLFD